jgi:WD40 repeat protein
MELKFYKRIHKLISFIDENYFWSKMFSKKSCFFLFILVIAGFSLSAQTSGTLKSKIKLDTTYNHGADVYVLLKTGDYTAFGDENGGVYLIDSAGEITKTPIKHNGWINTLCYIPEKKILVSGGSDGILSVLDITTNSIEKTIQLSQETITKIEFISDSVLLVTSDRLFLVNIDHGVISNSFSIAHRIVSLTIDEDKKSAYLGLDNGNISVFDVIKFKSGKQLTAHKKKVTALCLSGDRKNLISGDEGGTFTVWQLKDYKILKSAKCHADAISSIVCSDDNKYIVTAGWDKNIFIWNRNNYKLDLNVNAHKNIVTSVLFNNHKFLTASFDNTIKVWSNF